MIEEAKIREFLKVNFLFSDDGRVSDEDSLIETGVLDSTGVLELVGFLEREFGVAVDDEEMVPENLDSIRHAAQFVRRKTAARPGREIAEGQ